MYDFINKRISFININKVACYIRGIVLEIKGNDE